jgi:DOPA 4,5-dioxygenase
MVNMSDFRVNSAWIPKDFPREFDAHIYFNENTLAVAQDMQKEMKAFFAGKEVFVGDLINRPIGPHPYPMFEANFPVKLFTEMVLWISQNRKGLSVLVHPQTEDEYNDHSEGAIWLGAAAELKLSLFTR